MTRLLIGTGNQGKLGEYRALLGDLPYELVTPQDLDPVPAEPDEDAATFIENAAGKAVAYARATGLPTVADDSGLEVAAMRGAPGVRSRRYFGDDATDRQRNPRLLGVLEGVSDRSARFVCVIALAFPDGRVETFEGEVRGSIGTVPHGTSGHGYDPVFVVGEGSHTMAELSIEEKNRISHRGRAAAKLRERLAKP